MKTVLRILAFTILATATAARAESKDEPKKVAFELLKTRHMVIEAKINGKGPYRLIFDTGAPLMLVNNKLAQETGIIDKSTKKPPLALFGTMGTFKIKSFEIGELKANEVTTAVMDHPTVEAINQMFGPIYGIVGYPFFSQYRMTIDYQAKEMTFVPNGYQPTDIFQSIMNKMTMGRGQAGPTILSPAAQWGFSAEKETKDEAAGVVVKEVLKGSPADLAGLKVGDRLLTLDSRWTDSLVDLFEAASRIPAGKTVPLTVARGKKNLVLKVTPVPGL